MYVPVKPLVLRPLEGDKRPLFGPTMIAARCKAFGIAHKAKLVAQKVRGGWVLNWALPSKTD